MVSTALVATLASVPAVQAEPRPTTAQVQREVSELYHRAEQATERYNEARVALAQAERKFAQAQSRVASTLAELAKKQDVIGAIAVEAYRSGGVDPRLQIFLSDDPKQVLARASTMDMIAARQAASLSRVAQARRDLQADKLVAAQQLAAVEQWRRSLAQQKSEVERTLRAAQDQLNSLQAAERRRLAEAAARRQAASTRASRDRESSPVSVPASGRAAAAVEYAYAQLGDAYVWGAAGPDAFDCSGLTMMAWRAAGVSLPHSSREQYNVGTHVSRSQLQPGDLVFFYSPISHVGIYIGGGNMIHAPNPSERVQISPISQMPYTGATRP